MTASHRRRRRGFSLIEVMTVCIITGVLAAFGVPRFSQAMEQSRANIAVANLRAVWTVQRAYWLLNNATFAPDLATLRAAGLLDRTIIDQATYNGLAAEDQKKISYVYQVTSTDPSTFQATAIRVNSTVWASTLAIDSNGDVTGTVQYSGTSADFTGARGGGGTIDQFFQ